MTMGHAMAVVLWGFVATVVMTTIMVGAQGLGLSRLSLPFLLGSAVTGRLRWSYVSGYVLYALGAWAFAFLYVGIFATLGLHTWWFGAVIGFLHGIFLLTMLMHVPLVHPRMACDYDRPRSERAIEPPGFFGMFYGRQTPVTTLLAHTTFGIVLGGAL